MVFVFNCSKITNICLGVILTSFSLAVITPPPAYAQLNINLNDVTFALKIEKLVEKILKYKDKEDSNKVVQHTIELKSEIENYLNITLDIDKEFIKIKTELKNQGAKGCDKDIEKLKRIFKKKDQKQKQRALCMACYLQDNPAIPFLEYEQLYLASKNKEDDDKKNEEMVIEELPAMFVIGVSMMLASGFLFIIGTRIPACSAYAKDLFMTGASFATGAWATKQDENRQKDEKKDKK